MKSIRSKLITYFFVFVILFNIVATAIFLSSNQLMKTYNSSFERFLLFNSISQKTNELIEKVNRFVVERDSHDVIDFQKIRREIENEKIKLTKKMDGIDPYQLKKYENVIDTLIVEGELTIGFAIRDNIDMYNDHLEEAQNTAIYLKEITLDLIDLELTEYQSFYQQLNERNDAFRQFIIYLFLTSVLLAVFFALWFSKELNEPIQVLTNMAREVSAGKLDGKTIEIQSNDEMKILGEAFNQMRGNIRELIQEMQKKSEQEQLMKELELKHLQNQVNPHFLFNTLNTISRMAFLENADQTTRLIESVSSLLRYSLGDLEKSVPLREEVKVVKDYFYIQQTRFFDRITFHTDIDEGCLDTRVPRLYSEAFGKLAPYLLNSFYLVIPATIISALLGAMNGYVISKWKFKGSEIVFTGILFGMFIPYQSILIPLIQFLREMGLYNTITGLVFVHVVYGIPITTLMFRNFYANIPDEMIESAKMDGAGFLGIFRYMILPLSISGFVVVGIWQFTNIWNEFLFAATITQSDQQPIMVALQNLSGSQIVQWNVQMAGALIAALPTLLVYIFLGKYFVRGLLAGSVKG